MRAGRSFSPDEFAIALEQVVAGTTPADYSDPAQFFSRTCFTDTLTDHNSMVLRRLAGETANTTPALSLITQFGGGKTHTLTALYHLADTGPDAARFPGVADLVSAAGNGAPCRSSSRRSARAAQSPSATSQRTPPRVTTPPRRAGPVHQKPGRELRDSIVERLAWQRVARDVEEGILGAEFNDANRNEVQARQACPLISLRQSFLNDALTRLLDPDIVLREKIAEFVHKGEFGLASGEKTNGEYERIWHAETTPAEEILFENGVFLLTQAKAEKLRNPTAGAGAGYAHHHAPDTNRPKSQTVTHRHDAPRILEPGRNQAAAQAARRRGHQRKSRTVRQHSRRTTPIPARPRPNLASERQRTITPYPVNRARPFSCKLRIL